MDFKEEKVKSKDLLNITKEQVTGLHIETG